MFQFFWPLSVTIYYCQWPISDVKIYAWQTHPEIDVAFSVVYLGDFIISAICKAIYSYFSLFLLINVTMSFDSIRPITKYSFFHKYILVHIIEIHIYQKNLHWEKNLLKSIWNKYNLYLFYSLRECFFAIKKIYLIQMSTTLVKRTTS